MIGELQGRIVSHCVLKRAVGLNYSLLRLAIKFGPKAFFRHTQRTSYTRPPEITSFQSR